MRALAECFLSSEATVRAFVVRRLDAELLGQRYTGAERTLSPDALPTPMWMRVGDAFSASMSGT